MKDDKLKKKLNLGFADLINKTYAVGKYELLHVDSPSDVDIDFLALYSHRNEYNKTSKTAVCFYEYDKIFDNKNGIYKAIEDNDITRLNNFKTRFKNADIFISPDYSQIGDGLLSDNIIIFKKQEK